MDRENLRRTLAEFGVTTARRAMNSNPTEEVILLSGRDYAIVDREALTRAIADTLPGKKVAVIEQTGHWRSEPV